jgi:hypothetical protein
MARAPNWSPAERRIFEDFLPQGAEAVVRELAAAGFTRTLMAVYCRAKNESRARRTRNPGGERQIHGHGTIAQRLQRGGLLSIANVLHGLTVAHRDSVAALREQLDLLGAALSRQDQALAELRGRLTAEDESAAADAEHAETRR